MASPMSWFRKNQKTLMAFFGITLIAIFLVSLIVPTGSFTGSGGARPRAEDPIVVRWIDGQLKASDLAALRYRHFQAQHFMQNLVSYASQKKKANVIPRTMVIPPIDQAAPGNMDLAERELVDRYLLAQLANKHGVVVTDAAIDEHLSLLVEGISMTPAELASVNRKANDRAEYSQVREQIRMELAARQMQLMLQPGGAFPMNPTQAAQYYTMNSRLIECEILPYKVEDYVAKVTQKPADEDLQQLYIKGKSFFPDKLSPRPGFKQPRKVALQYFTADFDTFLTNEMNKLTDKEVQDEYDRRVKANDMSVMEEVKPDAPTQPDGQSANPGDSPTADPSVPSAEGGQPEGDAPKSDNVPTPESNEEPKPSDTPAPEKQNEPEKKDGGDGTLEYVALGLSQDKGEGQPTPDETKQEEAPKTDSSAQDPEKLGDAAGNQSESGEAQKSDPQSESPNAPTPQSTTEQVPAGNVTTESPIQEPKKPELRPRPLKDVADQIKRSLKNDAARQVMVDALDAAEMEVRDFQVQYQDWEVADKKIRGAAPILDYKSIASRHGLSAAETSLATLEDFAETEVGKLKQFVRTENGFVPQNVVEYLSPKFASLSLYEPFQFRDVFSMTGDSFKQTSHAFWLTEKVDAKIPTYDEAKADLETYWRRDQAIKLALADAEAAAKDSTTSGKKLTDMFGEKASNTGQFPWYSSGLGSFGYFEIPGVSNPGEDFMKAAFGLKPGQAAAAVNESRDFVYVIRMIADDARSTEELLKQFAESLTPQKPYPPALTSIARNYQFRIRSEWSERFIDSLDVEWVSR